MWWSITELSAMRGREEEKSNSANYSRWKGIISNYANFHFGKAATEQNRTQMNTGEAEEIGGLHMGSDCRTENEWLM